MPTKQALAELVKLIARAPSADNSQPWKISHESQDLRLSYDSTRVAGKTFAADHPATLLAIGAAVEHGMQGASDWGMEPQLRLPEEQPDQSGNYAWIRISNNSQHEVSAEQHNCYQRHTNRCAYHSTALAAQLLSQLAQMTEGQAQCQIMEQPETIREASKLVKLATQIRFQRQDAHRMLIDSIRLSPAEAATGDGLDLATLGLPPGGGLFLKAIANWQRMTYLNRFGLFRLLARIDAAPVAKGPALIAITGTNDKRGAFDAGRLVTRIWTELNVQGIAVHPNYVISDQLHQHKNQHLALHLQTKATELQRSSDKLFNLSENTTLHMLLRVGYPKQGAVLSQRLPLKAVFDSSANT